MTRAVRRGALLALAVGMSIAIPVARADGDERGEMLQLINNARGVAGRAPLTLDEALSASACAWSDQWEDTGVLSHDPNLSTTAGAAVPGWRKLGENLGVGASVGDLHAALMASPTHQANLLDPQFSKVGICLDDTASGETAVTQRFAGLDDAPVKAKAVVKVTKKVTRKRARR